MKSRVQVGETHALASLVELHRIGSRDENRIAALRAMLAELEGRAVVWCRFVEDVERIDDRLVGYGEVYPHHGGLSAERRLEVRRRWAASERGLLVATPETAGVGVDLSAASDQIWFSHTWDMVMREQALERCTRIGRGTVSVTDLVGRGTLDEAILRNRLRKGQITEDLARELLDTIGGGA